MKVVTKSSEMESKAVVSRESDHLTADTVHRDASS
jgi:hypothetical protein